MNADLKQAILECFVDYFDRRYDGDTLPMWAEVMAEAYCADDGVILLPDVWTHMDKEIAGYKADLKRYEEGR